MPVYSSICEITEEAVAIVKFTCKQLQLQLQLPVIYVF